MRVLVTGSEGMLGHALRESCPADVTWVPTTLADLDVTDGASVTAALTAREPDAVVNAAAYTDVDGCESHEDDALAVNGTAPGLLAAACEARGIPLLHVSTDYVYDGSIPAPGCYEESDPTSPLSAYGRTKLAGEVAVAAATSRAWVLRTQWLYGLGGKNFVETMLRLGAERDVLEVVDDQVGAPTCTHDLAPAIWEFLVRRPAFGTYHAVSEGSCSWHAFACEIFEQAGLEVDVRPIDSGKLDRPAPRPARSVLSTARLRAALGHTLPDWREGLRRYLARRPAEATP